MTIQLSDAVRNARGDVLETTIAASPLLKIYTGAQPANCAAVAAGTLLTTLTLPADWLSAAAAGVKTLVGTWQQLSAAAAGTCGHFRIWNAAGTVCHMQGSVTATGGGGDMTVDNAVLAVAQAFNVTAFTLTEANP